MKNWIVGICVSGLLQMLAMGGPRDADWKKVRDSLNQALPQSALTNLAPILSGALADRAWAEATRAIGMQASLESLIEGGRAVQRIRRLQPQIPTAPPEIRPVLELLLGHWYLTHYRENSWRYLQRSATSGPPGADIETWDLRRIFAEIDLHFREALKADLTLKSVPVADWNDLLDKGSLPDRYRPTLYDILVHQALSFYTSAEAGVVKPEDQRELITDEPYAGVVQVLGGVDEFLQGTLERRSGESQAEKALFLFRDLLVFHRNDPEPSALADADFARIEWAGRTAVGNTKDRQYDAALKGFLERWTADPISALARAQLARRLRDRGEWAAAHTLASGVPSNHLDSPGGRMCRNLIAEIEARSLSMRTEQVWNEPQEGISVTYRNLTHVRLRAVPFPWEMLLAKDWPRPSGFREEHWRRILARPVEQEWTEDLPSTPDFRERTEILHLPKPLAPGFHFLLASADPLFSRTNNTVIAATVWVSDLALIVRVSSGELGGFVLEANSGEPVSGATVDAWVLDDRRERVALTPVTTDELGVFRFPRPDRRSHLFRVRHQGRELASEQDFAPMQKPGAPRAREETRFFTDRAIYRPGQSIQYKGLCIRVDTEADAYQTLPEREVTVLLRDANGQEIGRLNHRCNTRGSFAGSFIAPRDRLLGQMTLQVDGTPPGAASVRVEEYKRPKFEVTLDAPRNPSKLGESVTLSGKALAYTGAAIDGAKVTYRITRRVRWPWWCWWRPGNSGSQQMGHGETRSGADGIFAITFQALPDLKAESADEPMFAYEVVADVTDSAGETRSANRTVNVGYTALVAGVSIPDWLTDDVPIKMEIALDTLDGEPQPGSGVIKIHQLTEPPRVLRRSPPGSRFGRGYGAVSVESPKDPTDPKSWPLAAVIAEKSFQTGTNGRIAIEFQLPRGNYRAVLETSDRYGKRVRAERPIQVLRPTDSQLGLKIPHLFAAPTWRVEPGGEFSALWGTGYKRGRAFVEIIHRGKSLAQFWTDSSRTQQAIRQRVDERMRGGFQVNVTFVRENRAYMESRLVEVPWSDRELTLKWESFRSKLEPGQRETWTLVIEPPPGPAGQVGRRDPTELAAVLYDASLDAFQRHEWSAFSGFFRREWADSSGMFLNAIDVFRPVFGSWVPKQVSTDYSHRSFPAELFGFQGGAFGSYGGGGGLNTTRTAGMRGASMRMASPMPALLLADSAASEAPGPAAKTLESFESRLMASESGAGGTAGRTPNLDVVSARKNLNETAFFFPQLLADSNGAVRMQFTLPEALTQWRLLGMAHDNRLRSGSIEATAVTSRDLMVQPNPPRFLREGDVLEFSVKVSNQGDLPRQGHVRLTFRAATDEQSMDSALGNRSPEHTFDIPARESRSFSWRITVPDGMGFLRYSAVAASGNVSDGEEGMVPVLSRRVLLTESLPLAMRGAGTKAVRFEKLLNAASSDTLRHQNLTVQMVSQPAWYAVMALPYLMEFPHECAEQIFNRYYANAVAKHIANRDPKIARIFELWRNSPALDSPLEKNPELKSVALLETPWLRAARNESEAHRNLGVFFEPNRVEQELHQTLQKLAELQLEDGRWAWFPGGRANDYITLYIISGFGRLRQLGVGADLGPALRALPALDKWVIDQHREILQHGKPDDNHLSSSMALYLYGRSFFLKDMPILSELRPAMDYFRGQATRYWVPLSERQSQGHLALAAQRLGDVTLAQAIVKSLRERSVSNEEFGMFWRDTEEAWSWARAPIETQALMIEVFDEVAGDTRAVEDLKVWLLKQKQTEAWKTTKGTADAVYGLLRRGADLLSKDALVEVTVGGVDVTPRPRAAGGLAAEPGTGAYEYRFAAAEVTTQMGEITVRKADPGVAWGGVHWQYFEELGKVTPHAGTPLNLQKKIYRRRNSATGPVLEEITGSLSVGDELVVRIELRADRNLEFVHLKDQRGSGLEPVNVLSSYKFQDGLGYYESTRDTASHFYIEYLAKGTYVFEYSVRVQHRGDYPSGVAEVQCMYAPEFNSHSISTRLQVQ
ncbi:MAG: hypothetical protein EXS36_09010 [Pedosphaera sp.]|nr:hypothetical protein [Pedosphaera sp.]